MRLLPSLGTPAMAKQTTDQNQRRRAWVTARLVNSGVPVPRFAHPAVVHVNIVSFSTARRGENADDVRQRRRRARQRSPRGTDCLNTKLQLDDQQHEGDGSCKPDSRHQPGFVQVQRYSGLAVDHRGLPALRPG